MERGVGKQNSFLAAGLRSDWCAVMAFAALLGTFGLPCSSAGVQQSRPPVQL